MSALPFTRVATEFELKDVFDLQTKNIFLSLNCHAIATVQSFDSDTQTLSATINYKQTQYKANEVTGLYEPILVDYPVLLDCPAIVLGGGNAALTMPIENGDECLILFNDRALDNWLAGGPPTGVSSTRLHSFADGIAIVGLRSFPNALLDYDTSRAVLRNGLTKVPVGATTVEISNAVLTLKGVINGLIDILAAAPALSGSAAALNAYKIVVGGLLE